MLKSKYFLTPAELYKSECDANTHYSTWFYDCWDKSIRLMLKLKMQLIPLQHLSKRPLFGWTECRLNYKDAMYFALKGCNLAVVCNNWFLLDLDRADENAYLSLLKELREIKNGGHILTANTARGFHFWLSWKPTNLQEICERYRLDVPRHSIMYALVPFSVTCSFKGCRDEKNIPKHKHRYIVRRWLDVDI